MGSITMMCCLLLGSVLYLYLLLVRPIVCLIFSVERGRTAQGLARVLCVGGGRLRGRVERVGCGGVGEGGDGGVG